MIIIDKKEFTASLAAMSAFLGIFESFLPMPVPFFRLGFANIPICLSLPFLSLKDVLFIVVFKLLFTHLFRGTLLSFPFFSALSGSLLFLLIVFPLFCFFHQHISFISISLIGAVMHNLGQLVIALFFIPFHVLSVIAVIMLPVGVITGVINGIICNRLYQRCLTRFTISDVLAKNQENNKIEMLDVK